MLVGSYGLGFSLNPLKAVKKAVKYTAKGVTYTAKGTVAVAKNPIVQRAAQFVPGGAQATAAVNTVFPGGKRDGTPAAPGEVDLRPAQDATVQDDGGGKGGGAMITLPGIGPVKRSHALIGGAVAGGVILLLLLRK